MKPAATIPAAAEAPLMGEVITWHLQMKGLVQGVGFRPFVYALATQWGLQGTVSNQTDGVHILINATEERATTFCRAMLQQAPTLSKITGHQMQRTMPQTFNGFSVIASPADAGHLPGLWIPPDFALCPACLQQMMDTTDRRYRYPFITCTTCGPRYSILQRLPYDRQHTTMQPFEQCPTCLQEYNSPTDSRFYAQTNSCPTCGIMLQLYGPQGELIHKKEAALNNAVAALKDGKIVAVKGIGGFLLLADAAQAEAIHTLRSRKHRPTKPLAILYPSLALLEQHTTLSAAEKYWLQQPSSPIVLLPITSGLQQQLACDQLAPALTSLGIMLPYAPLLALLLADMGRPLVATSGNLSGAPVIFQNKQALAVLPSMADLILLHNRHIVVPQDDSVLRLANHQPVWLRRSRGLAPALPWYQSPGHQTVLATGALMKSSFCLVHGKQAYLSQYLGNSDSYDAQLSYRHTLSNLLQLVQAQPQVLLADKHPHYFSHQLAQQLAAAQQIPMYTIQHHKAHAAAILAEHDLIYSNQPVMCIIWDGTGLGDDGSSWGGEFFKYHQQQFSRPYHIGYFPYLLPQKMAREPRLSALALLHGKADASHIRPLFSEVEWAWYGQMLHDFAGTTTSSVGRLFDAVACLLLGMGHQSFEGEAALRLETIANTWCQQHGHRPGQAYPTAPLPDGTVPVAHWLPCIMQELKQQVPADEIAAKFHYSLAVAAGQMARLSGCTKMAFSGGVFQNALLIRLLQQEWGADFDLYFHHQLPPNDEHISLGQMVYFDHHLDGIGQPTNT